MHGQQNSFCSLEGFLPIPNETLKAETLISPLDFRKNEMLQIRTVIHVVYNNISQNITDAKIESLITDLNMIWSAQNLDTSLIHPDHRGAVKDSGIQFCLAKSTPDQNSTNGITRTQTELMFFDSPNVTDSLLIENVKQNDLGGKSAWDPKKYFNIWIAPMESEMVNSNYGLPKPNYFPLGLTFSTGIGTPGVVLDVRNFLNPSNTPAVNILAHEIGHALGLYHPWGWPSNCENDDYMEDTPICKNDSGICQKVKIHALIH